MNRTSVAAHRDVGRLVVDRRSRRARLDGIDLSLTATEFELLADLADAGGQPVASQQLAHALSAGDPTRGAVEVQISRLRRKLGESGGRPQLIRTVRGFGYRLAEDMAVQRGSLTEGEEHGAAVVIVDGGLLVRWASATAASLISVTPPQLLGCYLPELVHPEDRMAPGGSDHLGKEPGRMQYRVRTPTGWLSVVADVSPIVGADGQVIGAIAEWAVDGMESSQPLPPVRLTG